MIKDYRGKSFKNLNLVNQDFSYSDIRGTDFTNAILKNTNFTGVRAGLELHSIIILLICSLLLAAFSGIISAINTAILYLPFSLIINHPETSTLILNILSATTVAINFLIFIYTVVNQGFLAALKIGFLFLLPFLILAIVFSGQIIKIGVAFFLGTAVLALTTIGLSTSALSVAGAIVVLESIQILIIIGINLITTTVVSIVLYRIQDVPLVLAILVVPISLIVAGLGNYIALQALKENERFTWIRSFALTFAGIRGTCFKGSDLTNANFTLSLLKSTNLRGANMTRTYWLNAQKLNLSLVGESYLKNLELRQLLVTGQGQNKNFDRQDLRGVNFQGANLVDASFIGADLSQAKLQDADLSRAKLVQTQLDGTDFTGATLTGAYIQDWGITTDTKFDGVRCEYIYMRLPKKENPDPLRKPDNHKEVFADGEFGDFIQPIFDTLDLYHNQGVDPRAIAISFKQLAQNHPEAELRIVGMEVRGEDKFLLRAKTAIAADKSQLSAEYVTTYNEIKGLPEREIKLLLEEKDSRIRSLETMVTTALERPSFYSNTQVGQVSTMANNPGGFSVNGSVDGNVNNVQGEGNRVVQGDTTMTGDRNINTGGGNYNERIERDYIQGNYYAAGQPQSLAQAAAEIQMVLKQLEQTYPTATTSQQMVVAAEAINRIESNPLLKERVINAVKEGGLAAFEKAIDNPAGAFIVGAIKGWQEVEAED
jgi:uncharacterized protein YjbI with pentapeptide repeats